MSTGITMTRTPQAVTAPVVVVGTGPVGMTAALLLAKWGLRVLVLEARLARDLTGSKAICQQRDVLDIWASVGASAIAEEGVTWTTARTYYQDRELFAWSFTDRGRSPLPPFVNISQSRTEELLSEQVNANPAIEVRWGHEVTGLTQDADGVSVACQTAGGLVTERGPYVIVCTGGRRGPVRRDLGVSLEGESFDDQFLICDIRAELPGWEAERRFYFDPVWNPGRQVLIHPCPDSTYRIDWQVPPDFDLAAEEATGGLDRRIRQVIGDRPYELLWHSVYRFHSRLVQRMRIGRVLLAGDCAHLYSPFGARGLNSGVLDAENAAWKLAFVLRGWAGDGEGLLESYHDERWAAAVENLEVTSQTMRFLVPRSDAEWSWRRSVLERALTEEAARPQVDSGRFAEPFWYVDSPLTTPDASRPFAGRPPKGEMPPPGPGILAPDAPVTVPDRSGATRFLQLAREGFTVLVTEGGDLDVVADAAAAAIPPKLGAPMRVLRLGDIDASGVLTKALAARPREAWVIRPDAHVAAIPDAADPAAITTALRRALGGDADQPCSSRGAVALSEGG